MNLKKASCLCLIVVLCISAGACASLFKNYGRIDPSDEVTRAFEEYNVNPDYRYYVSGPHINPNAIMGLDRSYRLDPYTTWREVNMTPALLKELIEGMKAILFGKQANLFGFKVFDDQGRQIGVWYSIMEARTFLKMNNDGTVRIDTPPLELYESKDDGSDRDRHFGPGR